jgi:uncharacterized Tic20 family protein
MTGVDDGPPTDEIPRVTSERHAPAEGTVPRRHRSGRRGEVRVAIAPAPAVGERDARLAMLAYLTVPFFGFLVPLTVCLMARRKSPWLHAHAAHALNVWLTSTLYVLSAVIMGAMLALDSVTVAVSVVLPAVVVLWLITLWFLVRAANHASQGEDYRFPRWLCTRKSR